ncbi:GNAT family N-acetyltransferase [Paenibacillus ihbetae]|uniref:GNAT family N-acetyltransferase n=1 Tax=Paenibacillus ihbetae TaxID=1870820 RepID=A0ABX3JZ71_9BACL|nr:GNAT family N-acetyltransferase [Paenibacillus ihbetae]OOC62029.1 GNAT family N-acetyltransferase [Paenibacillus ihbetae]
MNSIQDKTDWKQLSEFLARMNRLKQHHVGYCGEQEEEIYGALMEDFAEGGGRGQRFTVYASEGRIIGALGFQVDEEDRSAEVWGPFIDAGQAEWAPLANQLWREGLSRLDVAVDTLYGFYNMENVNCTNFMAEIGAERSGLHTILKSRGKAGVNWTSDSPLVDSTGVEDITPELEAEFLKLHAMSFPGTYYGGKEILNRLNGDRRLFTAVEHGELAGYVYVEAEPEFREGSIEYIAVSSDFQRRGYGKKLLARALRYLFGNVGTEEISLCVSRDNIGAIRLYESMGFDTEHQLAAFVLKVEGISPTQEQDRIAATSERS